MLEGGRPPTFALHMHPGIATVHTATLTLSPSRRQITAPSELLACLRALVLEDGWPLERALPLFTSNPAARLKLARKGQVSHSRLATKRKIKVLRRPACTITSCAKRVFWRHTLAMLGMLWELIAVCIPLPGAAYTTFRRLMCLHVWLAACIPVLCAPLHGIFSLPSSAEKSWHKNL